MLLIHSCKAIFFSLVFLHYIMIYILNLLSPIEKITIKELMSLILENYYREIGFPKEKNTKLVKRSKIITQQPKSIGNLNIVDIK